MFLFHLIMVVKNDGYFGDSFIFNFYVLRIVDDKLPFSFLWRNCTEKSPKFPVSYQQNSHKARKTSNENFILTGDIRRLFFGLRIHLWKETKALLPWWAIFEWCWFIVFPQDVWFRERGEGEWETGQMAALPLVPRETGLLHMFVGRNKMEIQPVRCVSSWVS